MATEDIVVKEALKWFKAYKKDKMSVMSKTDWRLYQTIKEYKTLKDIEKEINND